MKRKKIKKYFLIIFFLISLVIGIVLLKYEKALSPKSKETASNPNLSGKDSFTQNIAEDPNITNNQLQISELQMPILMYHYIREYSDQNDKIGTNLSVSPENFAKQLDLIKEEGYTTITFEDLSKNNIPEKPIILTFDDGYGDFYSNAFPELKKREMKAVSYIIFNKIDVANYLTIDQIKELSSYGIEIGSHTLSHPDLSKLDDAKAEKEIIESKKNIEKILNKKIISFCYPSGKYSNSTENIVKNAGYIFSVTTKSDITTFTNWHALNRYRVNNDTNISQYLK